MPKAEQLPSGTWRIRVYAGKIDGKHIYIPLTATTKEEVELLACQYTLDKKRKKADAKLPIDKRMTVGDAIDQHIADIADVLSPTTVRRYMSDRERFFPSIMEIKLCDLTQPDIQRAVSHDSKKYSPKSVHCAHGLLSAALSSYLPDFKLKTNLPQMVEPDVIVPEDEDIQRFLACIEGTWMEGAVLLGACCGLRRSEICGLKFEDINIKNSTIYVRRTVIKDKDGKWVVREKTKTVKSKREIKVSEAIIERLLSFRGESDFIVNVVPDTISKSFIDLRDDLEIKCRFHDLRHYNASIMLALGIPDKYAMERMGYSTPGTLKKVYQHTMKGKRQEVADKVNQHMDELFGIKGDPETAK